MLEKENKRGKEKNKKKGKKDKRRIFHCKISESSDTFRQFVKKKQINKQNTGNMCSCKTHLTSDPL